MKSEYLINLGKMIYGNPNFQDKNYLSQSCSMPSMCIEVKLHKHFCHSLGITYTQYQKEI